MLVTGGILRLHAMSLVGDVAADALRATRISKGFLGAHGLAVDGGLMDLNPDEVRIKRGRAGPITMPATISSTTEPSRRAGTGEQERRTEGDRR